jgi:cytochrome c-type biogenesis protein
MGYVILLLKEGVFMTDISYAIAFWAGVISFFSPCIIPMIPAYISFISGYTKNDAKSSWLKPFYRTTGFVLGFSIVFILLGASATTLGRFIAFNLILFRKISGVIIIIFGLYMLNILKISFLSREKRVKSPKSVNSYFGSVLMGMAFGAGWTPCIGAVLASILVFASTKDTVMQGILLLSSYSIGLSLPFLIASLFIGRFSLNIMKIEKFSSIMNRVGGILLIVLGILIYTNNLVYLTVFLTNSF